MSSIRNRVLLVLLAAGLVPLLLILFVSQTLTRKAIEESQFDQMAGFTEEVGRNVTVFLDNSNKNLQSLTTNRIIQRQFVEDSSWTPEERESEREAFLEEKRVEFTRVAGAYTQFFDISLYDRSGRYVASTSKPKIVNLGYEKGDMFEHQSAVGGSPTISKPRVADSITLGDGPPKVEVVFFLTCGGR
ncbi:hypothetical protein OAL27_02665 [Verrucomicrobiales bacterium]|nr:hypothetical protein [Verrucomicrobiales bacterium]